MSGEKSKLHAYPDTIWPVNVFLRFILNRFNAENMQILLSRLWHANHLPLGDNVTDGIECIVGSAIYFTSTGISHSHIRILLSSDVVTKRRFSSTNVIELTAPKCRSYSWTISPLRVSHCNEKSKYCHQLLVRLLKIFFREMQNIGIEQIQFNLRK